MGRRFFKLAPLLLAAFFLSACAAIPTHIPLTAEQANQAKVEGFPQTIRFWADELPEGSEHSFFKSIETYRAFHAAYYKEHKKWPDVHFLALSGGGNDGAFGAGLLNGWSDSGHRPLFHVVTGVSTGALIAPLAFLGESYDQKLREMFTETRTDGILLLDIWTFLSGLTGGLSVSDVSPFVEQIKKTYTPEILDQIAAEHRKGRRLFIGTTNIEAQRGVIWNMGAIAASDHPEKLALFHKIIQASAAIPGVFDPVFINVMVDGKHYSEIHVDGGVTAQVFLFPMQIPPSVVNEMKRSGIERNLYVIRNAKVQAEFKGLPNPGLFSISARSVESLIKNNGLGDLYRLYLAAQRDGTHYHEAHIPSDFAVSSKEMFDPDYMKALFDLGRGIRVNGHAWNLAPPGLESAK